ncbi:hypothetical protein FPOAC2_03462 [Fusarium poae]
MEKLGGLRRPSRYTKRMPSSGGWLIVCSVNQALKGRLLSTVLPSDRHDNFSIIFHCLFLVSNFSVTNSIPTRIKFAFHKSLTILYISVSTTFGPITNCVSASLVTSSLYKRIL